MENYGKYEKIMEHMMNMKFFLAQHGQTFLAGGNLSSEILNICPRESAEKQKSFRMLKYAGCWDVPKKKNTIHVPHC